MSIDADGIMDDLQSHAMTLGIFERVNLHEPKSAPTTGLSCAIWVDYIGPVPSSSGLAATSALVIFNIRIYSSMLAEPQDYIDPQITKAVDLLMTAYSGDFELGGDVAWIDLLGQSGRQMDAQAGYINQEGKLLRIMTITLPVVLNDVWSQAK